MIINLKRLVFWEKNSSQINNYSCPPPLYLVRLKQHTDSFSIGCTLV